VAVGALDPASAGGASSVFFWQAAKAAIIARTISPFFIEGIRSVARNSRAAESTR
jgi:hypothetical protein